MEAFAFSTSAAKFVEPSPWHQSHFLSLPKLPYLRLGLSRNHPIVILRASSGLFRCRALIHDVSDGGEGTEASPGNGSGLPGLKAYIVYMGDRLNMDGESIQSIHKNLLSKVIASDDASKRLICSYTRSFNAMAAMLSVEEAKKLSNMDEVVSVFPNQRIKLPTMRSRDFMTFPSSAAHDAFKSNVIVGMLDTGIWP